MLPRAPESTSFAPVTMSNPHIAKGGKKSEAGSMKVSDGKFPFYALADEPMVSGGLVSWCPHANRGLYWFEHGPLLCAKAGKSFDMRCHE